MDPDLPLIEALQAGTDSALNELIDRHQGPLFRLAYRYLHDETAAQDIVQETFVRAFFKAASFRPRFAVKTWLYTIAINLCKDRLRRMAQSRGTVSLDVQDHEGRPRLELEDPHPDPAVASTQTEAFARLQEAINQLPHQLRVPLVLCVLEGQSHKEVAEIMDTTPKTIELRIYHAKAKLRELIGSG